MRPARKRRLKRAAVLAAGAVFGALAVFGLSRGAATRADIRLCRAVLPAIEPDGALSIDGASVSRDGAAVVRVDYRVAFAAGSPRAGVLRCAVSEMTLDPLFGRPQLIAVEDNGRPMGEARLFFLKRYWLGNPDALAEGERRFADASVAATGG